VTIRVTERKDAPITAAQWAVISVDPAFTVLVRKGILKAEASSNGGWALAAGNHVGKAILGGMTVEVSEKITGAFAALAEILAPRAFRMAAAPSPISPSDAPQAILARMFLASVRTYLSGAKLLEYATRQETGAYVSGRLSVVRTAHMRARGMRHKVAFSRSVLTDDLPLNRSIYAALGWLMLQAEASSLTISDISAARTLRAGFAECADGARDSDRNDLITFALSEAEAPGRRREVSEVAALAAAILQSATLTVDGNWDGSLPRSWFVNIENLYERAVRVCIADVLAGVARVCGPIDRPLLFPELPGRYGANPDVVIRLPGLTVLADAKYKDFEGLPSTPDVFELLSHAAAYKASRALLVFPASGSFERRRLGRAETGCEVWAFAIPFGELRDRLRTALAEVLPLAAPAAA
jgi:hypothetical protein